MKPLVCVVVPVFNEAEVLPAFHTRLRAVMDRVADCRWEVLFVNDGSTDGSQGVIESLRAGDGRIGWIDLSRNFGKEIAMTAGLDHAQGDAVVIIDADLQDPPELIEQLLQE